MSKLGFSLSLLHSSAAGVNTSPPPVNTGLPTITGGHNQGDTQTFTPGTWIGAVSYRYRVRKGTVSAPGAAPGAVLLDWTTATSGNISGITDGDYLWLDEEATGAGGVTAVATSAAGNGPMTALVPADTSIVATGTFDSASETTSAAHNFSISSGTGNTGKGFLLFLMAQTTEALTWDTVQLGGIALTKIDTDFQQDSTRGIRCEVWGLWGSSVPEGSNTCTFTRGTTSAAVRTVAIGITYKNAPSIMPTASDIIFPTLDATDKGTTLVDGTHLGPYSWTSDSTVVTKTWVQVVAVGQWITSPTASTFTPDAATSWTKDTDAWAGGKPSGTSAWMAAMHKVFASITANYTIKYAIDDTGTNSNQRYGYVALVRFKGDNST